VTDFERTDNACTRHCFEAQCPLHRTATGANTLRVGGSTTDFVGDVKGYEAAKAVGPLWMNFLTHRLRHCLNPQTR
jgi:hypothetical protein